MSAGIVGVVAALLSWGSGAGPRASLPREPDDFDVLHYTVDLEIDRDQKRIVGHEQITFRSTRDGLAVIAFPRNGLVVLSATSPSGAPLVQTESADRIEVRLPAALVRDQRGALALAYETDGAQGRRFRADAVYTGFFTCHWMICRERPDDKATLALSITCQTGCRSWRTVCRSRRRPRRQGDGATNGTSRCLRLHLFGFAIGKFSGPNARGQARGSSTTPRAPTERGCRPGSPMTIACSHSSPTRRGGGCRARSIARSSYDGGVAQEMSSFSLLAEGGARPAVTDPTEDWAVAHELAHQFWGNLITSADWSHFWLNEGLTTFMVAAYKEQRWGRPAYERELKRAASPSGRHDAGMACRLSPPANTLRSSKRAITYSKAVLFLDRLRQAMGERAFWGALKRYTRRFAGGSVVSQDFERVFAGETDVDVARTPGSGSTGPARRRIDACSSRSDSASKAWSICSRWPSTVAARAST